MDRLSITPPKALSPPTPALLLPVPTATFLYTSSHCCSPDLPTSCQSQRLLLCSCRSGRTGCIHLYILLLLQHDPQHHLSSLLVAAVTCVVDASGELTPTLLLLPSCLLNVPSRCCSLLYKVFSTRVSTRSSTMPFVLPTAQHWSCWSGAEMRKPSPISQRRVPACAVRTDTKVQGLVTPPGPLSPFYLGCKRSGERVCCGTVPKRLVFNFSFLF